MNKLLFVGLLLLMVVSFFLHLLALLRIFPFMISIPLLFISFLLFFAALNDRKRFKGF
ncbi:hypothetical protein ACQYAD_07180 [Neobacillus sp. SM06]|uniref:hypothetical protein n=1 Tax=Neobacillus sp. SM06 TaxID=3422492 RepID=UPI003D270373